ncbi:plasmid replication initiator protein [Sphingomonas sp. MM-1]|nr:plasmid replication initiator protein [Sphingomonas sp. MM-1]
MTIELSNWFYEGVLMQGGVLSIDRAYFDLTGGRERWLYKVARKHAGGAGEAGFAISMPTLFEKSGAEDQYRRFKFELLKIAERDPLPGFTLAIEQAEGKSEPSLRMRRRPEADACGAGQGATAAKSLPIKRVTTAPSTEQGQQAAQRGGAGQGGEAPATLNPSPEGEGLGWGRSTKPALAEIPAPLSPTDRAAAGALLRRSVTSLATRATAGELTDATLATLRAECPGWDYQTLHQQFRDWLGADPKRTPVNYQKAFIGFVRRYHEKNRYSLRG